MIHQAMEAKFADFEDALQCFSALCFNAGCTVSRAPRHYPKSSLTVFDLGDFLATYEFA